MKRLVWAPPSQHAAVWKNPPEIMLTSLKPHKLMEWRNKNSWADNIELIVFTDDAPPRGWGIPRYVRFAEMTGKCPHLVVNPPRAAESELRDILYLQASLPHAEATPMQAYMSAVRAVARALHGKRCGWLQPESDHASGACVIASEIGFCVALSSRAMIDSIGVMAAAHMEVNVTTLGQVGSEGLKQ